MLAGYAARADRLAGLPRLHPSVAISADGLETERAASEDRWGTEICAVATTLEAARAAYEAGRRAHLHDLRRPPRRRVASGPVARSAARPVADEICREADHARIDPWIRSGRPSRWATSPSSPFPPSRDRSRDPQLPAGPQRRVHPSARAAGGRRLLALPELTLGEIERIAPHAATPVGIMVSGARAS